MDESSKRRAQTLNEVSDAKTRGEQGTARSIFQTGGQIVGAAIDPVVIAAKEATPAPIKRVISTLTKPIGVGVNFTADKISDIPAVQRFSQTPASASLERDVSATGEYLNLLPGPKGVTAVANTTKRVATVATNITEKTGKTVAPLLDKPSAPFAKSYDAPLDAAFKREGIEAPISAVTKSPFLKGAEGLAAKSVFGRKIVEQTQKADLQLETKTNAIIQKITPAKTISDENLGKTIQEGMREFEYNFKVTEEKVYTDFAKTYGKAETSPTNTTDMLAKLVAEQGLDFFRGVDPRLANMYDRLIGETAETKKMRKDGIPEAVIAKERANNAPNLTYNEIKETRTSVGEQLARDPDNTALKRLYGALSQDLKAVVNATDKKGAAALQKLDADYKAGKQKIESRIASSIEQSNPERIAKNIITRNSAETLSTLKGMIGEARFAELSKTFMRQMFEDSVTRGKFDLAKLKSKFAEFDSPTMEQIMSKTQRDELQTAIDSLERLQTLSDALKSGRRMSDGSQTAFLQEIKGTGARVGAFVTALGTGQFPIAAAILFGTGMEAAYAKLFTSPLGRKFLTEGFGSAKTPSTLGDYLRDGNRSIKTNMPYRNTPSAKPVIPKSVPQTAENARATIKLEKKYGPVEFPDTEAFPDLLKNKPLQTTIDRHMLEAQVQIDTIGRQGMRKKGSLENVLTTTKTNLAQSLRDADMPTFADLVEKFDVKPFTSLQAFKEALMEYLRNAQPGLSMKNVGRVHPEDRQVMIDFIDSVRTGKVGDGSLTPQQRIAFEVEARQAAPGYGINPELTPTKLAAKFDELLARAAEKKGKQLGAYLAR